jgi:TRAP-type C4-dicarboxylate transport system permease large subunit
VKSVLPEVPLGKIFRGVLPYIFALSAGLALVLIFPPIATALPALMR